MQGVDIASENSKVKEDGLSPIANSREIKEKSSLILPNNVIHPLPLIGAIKLNEVC